MITQRNSDSNAWGKSDNVVPTPRTSYKRWCRFIRIIFRSKSSIQNFFLGSSLFFLKQIDTVVRLPLQSFGANVWQLRQDLKLSDYNVPLPGDVQPILKDEQALV